MFFWSENGLCAVMRVLNMRYAEFMCSDACAKYAIRGVYVQRCVCLICDTRSLCAAMRALNMRYAEFMCSDACAKYAIRGVYVQQCVY